MRTKHLSWFFRALAGLAWLCCAVSAQAALLELKHARSVLSLNGNVSVSDVLLPYHWDRLNQAQNGGAEFELSFSLAAEPVEPYALYFLRIGNAYEIWLNGSLLSRSGDMQRNFGSDYSKAPRYVTIAPQLLQKQNILRVIIRADGGRRGGLSAPLLGPESEVREVYQKAYRWRLAGSLVVSIFSLFVGTIALVLWLALPRPESNLRKACQALRDPMYLFAGLAELAWALRMGDTVIEQAPLPWPWWGIVVSSTYVAWICGMSLFCHEVAGLLSRRSYAVLLGIFISGIAATCWALLGTQPVVWTVWLGAASLSFVGYGFYYSWHVLRQPKTERVLVAVAVILNVMAGFHDWLAVRMVGDFYRDGSWVRYTSVLFGSTLLYIVVTRFRAATAQSRDLQGSLAQQVAQKERELDSSYRRLEALAREQERMAERTRILRDMHDGVGSHISAAIRQLSSGKASNAEVLQTLRDSLDQLKLSIDSMHLLPGDITALLANLRYRLEPRFASSGIAFEWDVDELSLMERLDHAAMRQLQYMLFEALSNVLQHAQATVLRIEAHPRPAANAAWGEVYLRVIDNGQGFDVQASRRSGLNVMRERAVAIGALLSVQSRPGYTVVEFGLPC